MKKFLDKDRVSFGIFNIKMAGAIKLRRRLVRSYRNLFLLIVIGDTCYPQLFPQHVDDITYNFFEKKKFDFYVNICYF